MKKGARWRGDSLLAPFFIVVTGRHLAYGESSEKRVRYGPGDGHRRPLLPCGALAVAGNCHRWQPAFTGIEKENAGALPATLGERQRTYLTLTKVQPWCEALVAALDAQRAS